MKVVGDKHIQKMDLEEGEIFSSDDSQDESYINSSTGAANITIGSSDTKTADSNGEQLNEVTKSDCSSIEEQADSEEDIDEADGILHGDTQEGQGHETPCSSPSIPVSQDVADALNASGEPYSESDFDAYTNVLPFASIDNYDVPDDDSYSENVDTSLVSTKNHYKSESDDEFLHSTESNNEVIDEMEDNDLGLNAEPIPGDVNSLHNDILSLIDDDTESHNVCNSVTKESITVESEMRVEKKKRTRKRKKISKGETDFEKKRKIINKSMQNDSSLNQEEIDAWLEEGFAEEDDVNGVLNVGTDNDMQEENNKQQNGTGLEMEKVVLVEKGPKDPFDDLPAGWVTVTHDCGMPVYLHKETRVCCMARPYSLGLGSARRHDLPLNAIPCLKYQKILEKEKRDQEEREKQALNHAEVPSDVHEASAEDTTSKTIPNAPTLKIETAEEISKWSSIDTKEVTEYCKRLFEMKTLVIKQFPTWKERRKHFQEKKMTASRPKLPENTRLLTCALPKAAVEEAKEKGIPKKKEFILNPKGKSCICILHEYFQHTMKIQPQYVYKELENGTTPYQASIVINGIEYGAGYGISKKQAKNEAAKSALEILLPGAREMLEEEEQLIATTDQGPDISFFRDIKIEDPRISQLSVKASQPSPYELLCECLQRNHGMALETNITFKTAGQRKQQSQYLMTVGDYSATVTARNKREGKHMASQAILQKLHPYLDNWGSILKLYGGLHTMLQTKQKEQQQVTTLFRTVEKNNLDTAVLDSLKTAMKKLCKSKRKVPCKTKLKLNMVIPVTEIQKNTIADENPEPTE